MRIGSSIVPMGSFPAFFSSFLQSYLDIAVDRSSIHSVNHFLAYSA
jgi:hypothetical protein